MIGRGLSFVFSCVLAFGCASRIAPPPPSEPPGLSDVVTVPGAPIVIAARAARSLQRFAYNTKRFSSDSTWGFRGTDKMSIRLRYVRASGDSTRALIELWSAEPCPAGQACLRDEFAIMSSVLSTEDPPPS